jgi:hypothetical protein
MSRAGGHGGPPLRGIHQRKAAIRVGKRQTEFAASNASTPTRCRYARADTAVRPYAEDWFQ